MLYVYLIPGTLERVSSACGTTLKNMDMKNMGKRVASTRTDNDKAQQNRVHLMGYIP